MLLRRVYLFIQKLFNTNKCTYYKGEEYINAEVIQSLGLYERVLENQTRTTRRHLYNKILYTYLDSNTKKEVIGEVNVPCHQHIKELMNGDKIRLVKNKKTGFISFYSIIKHGSKGGIYYEQTS